MNKYILSIVIPTRNREYYANACVRQVLSLIDDNVQIVIQDNSDSNTLYVLLEDVIKKHSNICYNYDHKRLSFVDNFNNALMLSQGEYVTIIGDDDGITSMLIKAVEYAKIHNLKAIKPNLSLIYYWPDSKVFDADKDNGNLRIYNSSYNYYKTNTKNAVKRLLKKGCMDYLSEDLVKIYHGVISRELLEKIRIKTGRYVGGLTPDIYLAVALSLVNEDPMLVIDYPLTISGICKGSGSSNSSTGDHTGYLKDAPHFIGHDKYEWNKNVPMFYSVETIWADSALAAINDIDKSQLAFYNKYRLVAKCLEKYPSYKKEITKCIHEEEIKSNILLFNGYVCNALTRINKSIKYRTGNHSYKSYNCLDIAVASKICELELSNHTVGVKE